MKVYDDSHIILSDIISPTLAWNTGAAHIQIRFAGLICLKLFW